MIPYTYKAMDARGRIVSGRMLAANLSDLETRLKRIDLDLIRGVPARGREPVRVRRRELVNLYFHLEQLVRAGVPLIEALTDLRDNVDDGGLRAILAAAVSSIEGGRTLSQAMEEQPAAFDEVTVHLVRAGESSGRLPEVLAQLVGSLKWQDELAAQSRRVAAYPLFLAALMLALMFFMLTYLVPRMVAFVKGAGQALPWQTELLIAVSSFVSDYWGLLFSIPAMLVVLLHFAIRANPRLRFTVDLFKLKLPLLGGILRKLVLARFAATFSMMYASGVTILESLHAGEGIVGNAAIAAGLRRSRELIAEGASVSSAFGTSGTFPPLVVRMLHVGESSGALDRALDNVAYFYHRDVRESVERLQTLAEPALTLMLGAVMGWIMLSVLGPIYDVIGRLKV